MPIFRPHLSMGQISLRYSQKQKTRRNLNSDFCTTVALQPVPSVSVNKNAPKETKKKIVYKSSDTGSLVILGVTNDNNDEDMLVSNANPMHFAYFGLRAMRIDGISVIYFQFMHLLSRPHYVGDVYLYSV